MTKCPKCGKEIEKEGHPHCTACTLKHDAIRRGEGGIHWEYTIPLVKNTVLWRDLVFALGLPVLVIAVIVVLFSNAGDRLGVLMLFGGLFVIFLFIAFIVMVAVSRSLGGGLAARFYVNNAGVGYEAGSPAKKISRGTLVLSLMSGSINAAGTSLVAVSQEENFIPWQDVRSVKIYARQRVIYIRSKELISPIALYCPQENFSRVTDMIAKKVSLPFIKT
ncbi:MAG: hypothetical protein OS112_01020 [Methanoregula sp.]|nr:MAG: hypothetical protein OS112_01020 [Methanoregula sp.]